MRQTIQKFVIILGAAAVVVLVFKVLKLILLSALELMAVVLVLMAVILALVLLHCLDEGQTVADVDCEISEEEILDKEFQEKVQFVQDTLEITRDSAESVLACFSTAGITNIQEIRKVDSICGISAYIIDGRGDRFFLELDASGCLESLRKNDRSGSIIFMAREQWGRDLL